MNINATLLGQMITFALFVWVTMKYIWPPVMKALEERKQKVAEGLAAADRGHHELQLAQQRAVALLKEAKDKAAHVLEQANKRSAQLVEESKQTAKTEGERMITMAQGEINEALHRAKADLNAHLAALTVAGLEKLLATSMDEETQTRLMKKMVAEI